MEIYGLNKTTLLDYPQRTACTIFTGNCNLRCVYCHNSSLVSDPDKSLIIPEEDIFAFLEKRKNVLQGVCITGGEPTVQNGLKEFTRKIKGKGYDVKLDTNGLRPDVIKELVSENLLNMIAMDIKADRQRYPYITGVPEIDLDKIDESIRFLISCNVEYEFRTTVVKEYFDEAAAENIGQWLNGSKCLYLQSFTDSGSVPVRGLHACGRDELEHFAGILSKYIERVELRGVE